MSKYLLFVLFCVMFWQSFAAESATDWQSQQLFNDMKNNYQSSSYFYYYEDKINYPSYGNIKNQALPEINVMGLRVHDGVMDLNNSSHMFFTFGRAVFIIDY